MGICENVVLLTTGECHDVGGEVTVCVGVLDVSLQELEQVCWNLQQQHDLFFQEVRHRLLIARTHCGDAAAVPRVFEHYLKDFWIATVALVRSRMCF